MGDSYPVLAKTTTTTSGTGSYVVSTALSSGAYRTLKQATADGSLTDGDLVHYYVADRTTVGGVVFEEGEGIYDDTTNTITRAAGSVVDSSSGLGVLIDWPASGQRDVVIGDVPPVHTARLDRANVFISPQTIQAASGNAVLSLASAAKTWFLQTLAGGQFQIRNSSDGTLPFRIASGAIDDLLELGTTATDQIDIGGGLVVSAQITGESVSSNTSTILNDDGGDNDTQVKGITDDYLLFADANVNFLGVGTNIPLGKLHVRRGLSTTAAPLTSAKDIVVERDNDVGISILCPDVYEAKLVFGSNSASRAASVEWDWTSGLMTIGTRKVGAAIRIKTDNNSTVTTFTSGGALVIGAASTINSSVGLELSSTTQAILPSRMTTTQKNALTGVNGMLLYDSTLDEFAGRINGAWLEMAKYTSGGAFVVGATTPTNSSVGLELSSTTQAFLPPRMTTTQRNALTPVNGMIVYDSTLAVHVGRVGGTWRDFIMGVSPV